MAALLVSIAVMGILMAAAMPVWRQQVVREKEAELVFRGEQYARAILLYQRKLPGALPASLDMLVDQRFLRKKYKDPMTPDGEFQPLYAMQLQPGQGGTRGAAGTRGGQGGTAGGGPVFGGVQGQQPGGGLGSGAGQTGAGGVRGGIIGVASKSTDESIMLYKGRSHYNEWQFLFSQVSGQPGQQGVPRGLPQPGIDPRTGRPMGPGMGQPGMGGPRGRGGQRGPGGRGPGMGSFPGSSGPPRGSGGG